MYRTQCTVYSNCIHCNTILKGTVPENISSLKSSQIGPINLCGFQKQNNKLQKWQFYFFLALKLCFHSTCGAKSAWLPSMCGAKSALLPFMCGAKPAYLLRT